MKITRGHITYWIRFGREFEPFPFWRFDNYKGFFEWLWFRLNWTPAIYWEERGIKNWFNHNHRYNRYMHLAGVLCKQQKNAAGIGIMKNL